jgi:hypothetical protein
MTGIHGSKSELQTSEVEAAIERCRAEIAAVEVLLFGGHPDVEGLCMALSDWSAELRILQNERSKAHSESA